MDAVEKKTMYASCRGESPLIQYDTDRHHENYLAGVENSALHYSKGRTSDTADASLTTTHSDLNDVMLGQATIQNLVIAGKKKITGNTQKLGEFVTWLDNFDYFFNIVTP